jgi:hypothetical protein
VRRSVLAALFGAAACYGVLLITEPPGPGLDPDSMSYLGAAESLVRHGTLRIPAAHWADADSTSPLGHFPPGFSLAIAVPVALGAPPPEAARGVEAVAALATVALTVWLVGAVAGTAAGALAGVVLMATPGLVADHLRVLSEPLCLALLTATLALMIRSRRPLAYGTAAAAAGLVRYAAVSATGAAVLWAFGLQGSVRERLRRAALAALPAIVLQGVWVLRTSAQSGSVRTFGLRGDLGPTFRELGATVSVWLAPSAPQGWARSLLGIAVGIVATLVAWRAARASKSAGHSAARLLAAAGLLAGCYAAMLLFSRLFVDTDIPFDDRILSPLFLFADIAAATSLGVLWAVASPRARWTGGAACAVWVASSMWATVRTIDDGLEGGWGYASDEWRASALGPWLQTEGRHAEMFSNNPATVWFLTHRPSRGVPSALDEDSVRDFGRTLAGRHGVLIRFLSDFEPMAPPDSLAQRLGLRTLASFPDGAVWGPAAREHALPAGSKPE